MHTSARAIVAAVALVAASLGVLGTATASPAARPATSSRIPVPAVPRDLPSAIESYAPYEPQTDCATSVHTGTQKLMNLLLKTYSDGDDASELRPCGSSLDATTEHADGRALDFGLSVTNAHQKAQADRLLTWLFATDKAGNADAMARRLGIMYVIWDGRIRMVGGGWQIYDASYCWTKKGRPAGDPTTCHRNHIHISLTWNGATGKTSFWTGRVSRVNYGPCVPLGDIFAPTYSRPNYSPCEGQQPTRPEPTTAVGSQGSYVAAVQKAVGAKVTGDWTSSLTRKLRRFQEAHHIKATGIADTATWDVINTMKRVGAP